MPDNEWIMLSDALNEILGQPTCPAPCEHGGRCSLENGHDGVHVSIGSDSKELCQWE